MSKFLWVDTETTGLSAEKHGIITMAGFIQTSDGTIGNCFDYSCQPHPNDEVNPRALEVNGYTMGQISAFEDSYNVISTWESFLREEVNPFDTKDKLTMIGYNTAFDMRFLASWFRKHGNPYFYSYFEKDVIDVLKLVRMYCKTEGLELPNKKLMTVAKHFNIDVDFHTAMGDIIATYEIHRIITSSVS